MTVTRNNNRRSKASSGPIDVIIETPKASRNKFKFDPSSGRFKLSKVMPEGMVFPYDFGFIPDTNAEDGDPLDVLVLTDEPLFAGCLIECKLLGAIEAEQTEKGQTHRNDRIVAVANQSILYSDLNCLDDLNPKIVDQIDAFFVNYQKVRGIEFKVLGHSDQERAAEMGNPVEGERDSGLKPNTIPL